MMQLPGKDGSLNILLNVTITYSIVILFSREKINVCLPYAYILQYISKFCKKLEGKVTQNYMAYINSLLSLVHSGQSIHNVRVLKFDIAQELFHDFTLALF